MEVFDITQKVANMRIPAGTILILQGRSEKAITMVHSGMAQLLTCSEQVTALSPEEIIDKSIRVGLIKGESVCGVVGLRSPRPNTTSVLAVTDCIITNLPVSIENLIASLQSRIRLNLRVLRALVQRIDSAVFLFKNYKYLWHKLASIQDSLALGVPLRDEFTQMEDVTRYNSRLGEYSEYLKHLAGARNLLLPDIWDHNLFLGRFQEDMGLYNDEDLTRPESVIDYQQFVFFKRMVKKSDKILANLFYKDEPSNYYAFQFLGKALEQLLELNTSMVLKVKDLLEKLYGGGGWVEQTLLLEDSPDSKNQNFNHFLAKFSWHCRKDVNQLLGVDPAAEYPVFKDLIKLKNAEVITPEDSPQGEPEDESPEGEDPTPGKGLGKYKNILAKLLEFAEVGEDFQQNMTDLVEQLKAMPDRFSMEEEHRQIRQELNTLFWELYEICLFKVLGSDLKSFIPGVMLHFGLIDEELVVKEDLETIDKAYGRDLYVDHDIPVMTLPYFLEKVYKGEVLPSMDDMGDSFKERLKRQKRFTKKETASEYLFKDTVEDRIRYEIRKIISHVQPLLFGNKGRALAALTSQALVGNAQRLYMDPEEVSQAIDGYRKRDFSLFFREVVSHSKFGSDVVKKEVLPNVVLYPTVGERMMMWQELDGRKRSTQGRFFLPLFFNGKCEQALVETLASFRWEISKTIAGAKWTDPVEGGLVGFYYDYINFYHRNPKLSLSVKDDIKSLIKKTRSDKERFIKDYQVWVENEFEGRIKLNAANRDIFYRFCPFPKEIREILAKKPLYTPLENRYQNNIRKIQLKMDSRKKRFERAREELPEDLREYLEYLDK